MQYIFNQSDPLSLEFFLFLAIFSRLRLLGSFNAGFSSFGWTGFDYVSGFGLFFFGDGLLLTLRLLLNFFFETDLFYTFLDGDGDLLLLLLLLDFFFSFCFKSLLFSKLLSLSLSVFRLFSSVPSLGLLPFLFGLESLKSFLLLKSLGFRAKLKTIYVLDIILRNGLVTRN